APHTHFPVPHIATAPPSTTDPFPPLVSEKSNGAVTVNVKVVVRTSAPLVPVTVIVDVANGVVPDVVSVIITEHVRVDEVGEKLAVVPVGKPDAVKVTPAATPDTTVAVTLLVTELP